MNKKNFLEWYDEETRHFLKEKEKIKKPYSVKFKGVKLTIFPNVWDPIWGKSTKIVSDVMKIKKNQKVLDIGTGSGILSILAAKRGARVIAIDINKHALKCAKLNVRKNKLEKRINIRYSNIFSNIKGRKFDIILFNPPQRNIKPKSYLGKACFDYKMKIITNFLSNVKKFMNPNRKIYLSYGNAGEIKKLEELIRKAGFSYIIKKKVPLGRKIYRIYEIKDKTNHF